MSSSRPRCRQPCLRALGDGGEEESTYKAWKRGDDRQNRVPWSPEDGELVAGQAWRCCLVGGPCTEPSAGRMGRLWEGTGAEQALPAEGAEKPRARWVTGRGLSTVPGSVPRRVWHRGPDLRALGCCRHPRLLHQHLQVRPCPGECPAPTLGRGRPLPAAHRCLLAALRRFQKKTSTASSVP